MNVQLVQDEVCNNKDQAQVIKGKRTKRPRALSPLMPTVSSSSSGRISGVSDDHHVMVSPSTSNDQLTVSADEEEDMAKCLILLARGHTSKKSVQHQPAATTATVNKGELYVYQCKTCNKCFNSFQALGGHRASHKRPKANNTEDNIQKNKPLLSLLLEEDDQQVNVQFNNTSTTALSLNIASNSLPVSETNKSKVHECSNCGAEFSSGQALGGHMRRHRSFTGSNMGSTSISFSETPEAKKTRNNLQLDLNLPAPEDDQQEFSFSSNEQVLVFSASPFVGCHY